MHDTTFCVEELTSCAQGLSRLLYHQLEETEDLAAHIDYLNAAGKMLLRMSLIENLRIFDEYLKDQVPKNWKYADTERRTLKTVLGTITYKKRIYLDEYGNRRHFLDEVLGIPPLVRIDSTAFIWLVRTAANISYQKTADAYTAMTGSPMTKQSVKRCVDEAGELLAKRGPGHTRGRAVSTPVVFCEFDGFYVHLQKETKTIPALPRHTYKEQHRGKSMEMKVWVAYAGINKNRRIGAIHWASDAEPREFFDECLAYTFTRYDAEDLDYLVTSSDAAGWCKAHGIDTELWDTAEVVSLLDRFHINQRVMRAFSEEVDRSEYLGYLYARDFDGFFTALGARMALEPEDERQDKRHDLYAYIAANLDWLLNSSLARQIRTGLADDIRAVFGDRSFCAYLIELLENRRYNRFMAVLREVCERCTDERAYDYHCLLSDAQYALALIERYRPVRLGTMEGTNSKVYAARLKVWGCAWSRKGAIAMMRIRAAIASGEDIPVPRYDAWFTEKEKASRERWYERSVRIPEISGGGYEPPKGSVLGAHGLTPALYGAVRT